ncbi:MAG: ParB N-terminal domain-containing protein [Aquamicrobium sp.]|nr:ParB N-terminal domain-containing protein [Aquamicrobium sp.]
MAAGNKKITLSSARDIPFDKLVLSQSNVRRIKAGISIDDLAASIARRGLIQSLSVTAVVDDQGQPTGMFEIPAGGRRYRALELLVKQKRLARNAAVPCVVRDCDGAILPEEVSLAENIERAPLHPLDQFRAFHQMRCKGMNEEDIAAAFFVSAQVVKQRLRLASVSPVLLDVYAEDGMTLEQLMAFTISSDHLRQEEVWSAVKDAWSKEPYQIRRMLTESTVRASDKRAVFLGLEAYEAAGGVVLNDLFQSDDGGWLQDPALLDRLVAEKLRDVAAELAAEGWKWVEAAANFPFDVTRNLRVLRGEPLDLPEDERAAVDLLNAEYQQLEVEHEGVEELPDDVDQRLGQIEAELAAFAARPVRFAPQDIERAGVFVTIAHNGALDIQRGYVRPEDDAAPEVDELTDTDEDGEHPGQSAQGAVITIDGQASQSEDEDERIKPLPDRLLTELTAHRTLALRNAVAGNPQVALTALLHKLVCDTFLHRSHCGSLDVTVRHVFFPFQDETLKDSAAACARHERDENWANDIPDDDDALWQWLAGLDDARRMALLAHCVSDGVNALYEKPNPYGAQGLSQSGLERRLRQADRLARETGLDMAEAGWRASVGNYLGRVSKARILEAVREASGEQAVQRLSHLKKADMAEEAERLLAASGWLPEPLRTPREASEVACQSSIDEVGETAARGDKSALGDTDNLEDDPAHAIAAE